MIPMRDVAQIGEGDKVYFEMGYHDIPYIGLTKTPSEYPWIATGQFQEINNIEDWLENDKFITDPEYLEHHNFMLIKNGDNG